MKSHNLYKKSKISVIFMALLLINFFLIFNFITCQQKTSVSKKGVKIATWIQLFNEKDLKDWEVIGAGNWKVKDGILIGSSGPKNPSGGWLINKNDYQDFHLRIQFQINEGGKGGICFREPSHGEKEPSESGYKINIDQKDAISPTGSIIKVARAYEFYERIPRKNPWNKMEAWVEGERFIVFLNNDKVAEGFDRKSLSGAIGIQVTGPITTIKVKEISILPLPASSLLGPTIEEQLENAPGTWKSLFNGKDLTGWKQPSGKAKWGVQDGLLTVLPGGGGGWLFYAEEDYSDFIFRLKFNVGEKCNSGAAYRYNFAHGSRLPTWFRSEVQIMGSDNIKTPNGTGAIYQLARNQVGLMKEGEWNELKIYALGPHIATYVNGKKAAEGYNMLTMKGAVGVSAHDPRTFAQFKDIEIKAVEW